MLDQVPYFMPNNWTIVCPLTKKEFPFGRDRESKQKALAEQQSHTRNEIERRERLAGRPLSLRELQHGITHVDTRTIREQVADANQPKAPAPDTDWVQARIDYLLEHPGHDPQERARIKKRIEELKRLAKKQETERKSEQETAEQNATIATDPKMQEALAHSATIFADLKFYKFATQKDVEQAEQRQSLAQTDPAAYWEAFWPWRKDWDARADAAAKVVTDSVSAEQARAKEIRQEAKEIETHATEAMQEEHPLERNWKNYAEQ